MLLEQIKQVADKLMTVTELLNTEKATRDGNKVIIGEAINQILYQQPEVTIGVHKARYAGEKIIQHRHSENIEFMICAKGKIEMRFGDSTRILHQGDCLTLRDQELHSGKVLTKDAVLIFVVIPADKGY